MRAEGKLFRTIARSFEAGKTLAFGGTAAGEMGRVSLGCGREWVLRGPERRDVGALRLRE